jgi:DNA modification methylase
VKAAVKKSTVNETPLLIELWPIGRPQPYAKNARTTPVRAIESVAASLKEFGWRQPIVVDAKDVIIAGHKRLLAAQKLGMTEVPVHVALGLTAAQCKAYRLMDNRSNQNSEWEMELLQAEMADLEGKISLEVTGFEQAEIAKYLAASAEGDPADAETVLPDEPVSVLGDMWALGEHRVLCGDSTSADALKRVLGGEKPGIIFTDPPYGVRVGEKKAEGQVGSGSKAHPSKKYDVMAGDRDVMAARRFYELCQTLGFTKAIIWGGNYFTDFLPPSPCWIVWDKENHADFADVELAWCSLEKGAKLYRWLWSGFARAGGHESEGAARVHQTQKPVGLFQQIFRDFEFKTCLDGFLGSGSTLIACQKTGRTCYGVEISPAYMDVIVTRWQTFTSQAAKLDGDGRTFDEIKAARAKKK